ncbi:MAG: DUF6498-containing protein [Ignavibacterium album]|jgi:hypothetical protein|uniref:DUF6498-containing protein n=1 Tax=Ignavibacterium album TaxID=591197 RepID=UPI0026F16662|nr:DUF6498-containing protein [Ignavibacterium album]MCX8104344.1 DUF6498-containing protein [Ignavibacterium album]
MKTLENKRKISIKELWEKVDFGKPTTWGVIGSNVAVIFFAIVDRLSASEVMWIYWIQSVIIGLFNFFRILLLKNFSTTGFKQNGKEVLPTKAAKISTAVFFLFHYGFFHLIYAVFLGTFPLLLDESKNSPGNFYLLFTAIIFLINYGIEFYKEQTTISDEVPNLGTVMFMPYFRIIPMHLTIILGGFIAAAGSFLKTDTSLLVIILLMSIKTFIDLITHSVNVFTGLSTVQDT